jgi:tetraacyldisaccharide 4'-kinase
MIRGFINGVVLFPYYFVLAFRHFLYDNKILKSHKAPVSLISVGNVTAGGTGKTPHTEYLINNLQSFYKVAVLSRGYGRKTKGFRMVETGDTPLDAGDEPLQIKKKFPHIFVAVDEKRKRGIDMLLSLFPSDRPDVIILDDAFQHRAVSPDLNILLIDYNRPVSADKLIPFGRLRDLPSRVRKADIIVVTKCPGEPDIEEQLNIRKREGLRDSQKLYFSMIDYKEPEPVFEGADKRYAYSRFAIILTSIANPRPLYYYVRNSGKSINSRLEFSDHHNFRKSDINRINKWASEYPKCGIYTTEKDSQRLMNLPKLSAEVKRRIFYVPIGVDIIGETGEENLIDQIKIKLDQK